MKAKIHKIIWADYLTMISILFPAVFWLIWLDAMYVGITHILFSSRSNGKPVDPDIFIWIGIAATAIFIPILYFRINEVVKHFANSELVMGTIVMIGFFRDRGRVEYIYNFNGQDYRSGNAIMKTKLTKSFAQGQVVELCVSRENPSKALIKKIYA
jgi:hypothetical protein